MTDLVRRGRSLAGNVSLNRQLGGFEWEGEDAQTIGDLCDEIERLEDKIKADDWAKPKLIEYKNEIERLQQVIKQLRTDNTRLRNK